jgi:hypothetical protein
MSRPLPRLENTPRVDWSGAMDSSLFDSVACDGYPLVFRGSHGALSAQLAVDGAAGKPARIGATAGSGPLRASLRHQLIRVRPAGGEDALMAEVRVRNTGTRTESATLPFATSAHPARSYGAVRVHLPLTAGPHSALLPLGMTALLECGQAASHAVAHYLEPSGSDPRTTTTHRMLLIPLASRSNDAVPWRVSMFGSPERPWRLASDETAHGESGWLASTRLTLAPGAETCERFFLFLHNGQADVAAGVPSVGPSRPAAADRLA